MINRMDYIVKYNGNKGDILLAKKTCESVVLGIANSILEETKESENSSYENEAGCHGGY